MNNEEIKILISLESLHRYVFDKIYVQGYDITKEDRITLDRHTILCEQYPTFRQDLADIFIGLYDIDSGLRRLGRTLSEEETEIYNTLKNINFSRYSITGDSKNRIREIKKDKRNETSLEV